MTTTTKTIEITSASGRAITATISYKDTTYTRTFDGIDMGIEHYIGGEIIFRFEGRRIGRYELIDGGFAIAPYEMEFQGHAGWRYGDVLVSDEGDKAIKSALQEAMDEVISQDVKDDRTAKAEALKAETIADAERIIAKADAQSDIPTHAEALRRIKAYNDLHNEGGDGWTPEIIDAEQVAYARSILANA